MRSCGPLSPHECLVEIVAWVKSKQPGSGDDGPPPEPKDTAIQRISFWVENDFLKDNITYGELVDWYDQGVISRDAVLKDRARYLTRWPERSYKLVPGSIRVTSMAPNRYAATFEQTYVVRSAPRNTQSSGKAAMTLEVEVVRGQPHVVKQRETTGRP